MIAFLFNIVSLPDNGLSVDRVHLSASALKNSQGLRRAVSFLATDPAIWNSKGLEDVVRFVGMTNLQKKEFLKNPSLNFMLEHQPIEAVIWDKVKALGKRSEQELIIQSHRFIKMAQVFVGDRAAPLNGLNDLFPVNRWGFHALQGENHHQWLTRLAQLDSYSKASYNFLKDTHLRKAFDRQWQKLSPGTEIQAFTLTGADAVGLTPSIALAAARAKHGSSTNKATIITFDHYYSGGRGSAAGANFYYQEKFGKQLGVPEWDAHPDGSKRADGWVQLQAPISKFKESELFAHPEEEKRLEAAEKKALTNIQNTIISAKATGEPVGAILMEPLVGAKGVLFYRDSFLSSIRQIGDEHGIAVVADEVLSGGRSGSTFFLSEKGPLNPDYFIFGKSTQMAGIARRQNSPFPLIHELEDTTCNVTHDSYLRVLSVLQGLEQYRNGPAAVQKSVTDGFQQALANVNLKQEDLKDNLRVVGALIHLPDGVNLLDPSTREPYELVRGGRIMEQVNLSMTELKKRYDPKNFQITPLAMKEKH